MVKMGAFKIFLDGAMGGRTAALLEPYSDAPAEMGMFNFSEEELRSRVREAYAAGLEVSIHAIGDAAMERVLNVAESVYPKSQESDPWERLRKAGKRRLRIIHAMIIKEEQIERLKKLPVILDFQPGFLDDDLIFVEEKLGHERSKLFMPLGSFLRNGIAVSGGSDYPFGGKPPLSAIQCAVTRKNLSGFPHGGLWPEEAVSVYEAVSLYTKNASYCSSEESIKGTIFAGKFADMVVLDRDIFEAAPDDIKDINVIKTIVGGKAVYSTG
jgi:predicted amidohydrolase YtcJ